MCVLSGGEEGVILVNRKGIPNETIKSYGPVHLESLLMCTLTLGFAVYYLLDLKGKLKYVIVWSNYDYEINQINMIYSWLGKGEGNTGICSHVN